MRTPAVREYSPLKVALVRVAILININQTFITFVLRLLPVQLLSVQGIVLGLLVLVLLVRLLFIPQLVHVVQRMVLVLVLLVIQHPQVVQPLSKFQVRS